MNKLYSKIAALSVSLAMAVGVGVAIGSKGAVKEAKAVENVAYTLDGTVTQENADPYNQYNKESLITEDEIEWSVMGNTNQNPWRIGGKKTNGLDVATDRVVYSKSPISENISKVIFTAGTISSSFTINSFKLIVSTEPNGAGTVVSELAGDLVASGTTTFTRPSEKDWTGRYYSFVFNMVNNTTTQKYVQFVSAVFKYEVEVVEPDTITVSGDSAVTVGEAITLTALATKNSSSTGVNQNVTWESSDAKIATVSSNGLVTGVANGTVTITARGEDSPSIYGTHSVTVSGSKTDNTHHVVMPDDVSFGGYGNYFKTVEGVYMHFKQAMKQAGAIQLQAANGLVENIGKYPYSITTIELTVNADSNGAEYQILYASDGENFTAASEPTTYRDDNRLIYSIPSGNYYFKLVAGTGTLKLDEILVGFGNTDEASLVSFAATLDAFLDAECTGSGDTSPITAAKWAELKGLYEAGTAGEKAALVAVGASGSYHQVNSLLSRYDHIVSAYGYDNFLGREVASSAAVINYDTQNNAGMIIIIAVSTSALIGFGLLLILKKRKVQK